jgi:hypothetical protein
MKMELEETAKEEGRKREGESDGRRKLIKGGHN